MAFMRSPVRSRSGPPNFYSTTHPDSQPEVASHLSGVNAEQRLSAGDHKGRTGLLVAKLRFRQNGIEVLTRAQRIEPRVAGKRLVRVEAPVHDDSEDLDGAVEVLCVREVDDLVEEPFGIPKS